MRWDRSALFPQRVAVKRKESLHLLAAAQASNLAAARGLPEPRYAAQQNGVLAGRHPACVDVVMLTPESLR